MGCAESMNAEIRLNVEMNVPVFKTPTVKKKSKIRTNLRDFCKEVINANIAAEYRDLNLSFAIQCKGKSFTMKDCLAIYDLRLVDDDVVCIFATVLQPKNLELTLRIVSAEPKEITLKVSKNSLVRDLLNPDPTLRFIRGDIQLDLDQRLESYDIMNKSKLHILVDNTKCEEVQLWKIKKTGMILEAACMNSECCAYRQRICINLGLGEFDVNSEISEEIGRFCVCCNSLLGKVTKFGFCHCAFKYLESGTGGKTKDYVEGVMPGNSLALVKLYAL